MIRHALAIVYCAAVIALVLVAAGCVVVGIAQAVL